MHDFVLDVRCLQDPLYADRGIGRHAAALLRYARNEPVVAAGRLIGLWDDTMPALPDNVRALLDEVRGTAYTGAMTRPTCFVSLSPMTHDPLFAARLLHHPAVFAAAAVYDFIPLDDPDRYLPGGAARVDYHVSLRWLARHDLFLPISRDAAGRLGTLLSVRPHEWVVTGAPLDARFAAAGPGTPRHVLAPGGGDPRKNPEAVVRAHARARGLQAAGVPLLVTGGYGADWLEAQRRTAEALGGRAELVEAPGRVGDADLARLYADALCVAVPSRAEGFSLPVIEAMAAGAPVVASRIPAHVELIDDPALLFAPDDDEALAPLLDRALDPLWRGAVRAAQAPTWPAFRAEAVAGRFWGAVAARLDRRSVPAAPRGARPRLALLTPLPPDRSGVADYSAAMCAELGRRVHLHLFTEAADPPCPPGARSVEALSALPLLSSGYDRVVSVLGNSHFHVRILEHLLRGGGAAIAHDGRMLDMYHAHVGPRVLRLAEEELGRPLWPNEIWHWRAGDVPPAALILREIADAAEPLLLHSRATVAEVRRRYGRAALHLPFSQYRSWAPGADGPDARRAARERLARLGVRPGQFVLATFGFLAPVKAPEDCIWALELLRSWGVDARLHFVGEPLMPMAPLHALCDELGLHEHVWFADGFVDEAMYRDHLLAADLGIQLRQIGAGSVSGALSDCVGAGLRSVASAALADAIEVPGYVRSVPDNPSPVLLAEAAASLLDSPADTDAERRSYVREHGLDRYAERLCAALGLDPEPRP